MKPKPGYDYLATAAHFAAESSTGTNVNVCTTDDFTKSVDALVYYIDPEEEEMKIAYPTLLFDRNITDGRGTTDGGLVVGTIIKPKLGLQPKPFGEACYGFWQGEVLKVQFSPRNSYLYSIGVPDFQRVIVIS